MTPDKASENLPRLLAVYPNTARHPRTRNVHKSTNAWVYLYQQLPRVLAAHATEEGTYRQWAGYLEIAHQEGFPWRVRRQLLARAPVMAISLALGDLTQHYLKTGQGLSPGSLSLMARRLQESTTLKGTLLDDQLTAFRVAKAEELAGKAPWAWVNRLVVGVELDRGVGNEEAPVAHRLLRAAVAQPQASRAAYYAALLPRIQWDRETPTQALVLSLFTSPHAYRQPDPLDQPIWDQAWDRASPTLRSAVFFQGMVRREKWPWLARLATSGPSLPLRVEEALAHPMWQAPSGPYLFWHALDAFNQAPGQAALKDQLWASLTAEQQANLPQTLARCRLAALVQQPEAAPRRRPRS